MTRHAIIKFTVLPGHVDYTEWLIFPTDQLSNWLSKDLGYDNYGQGPDTEPEIDGLLHGVAITTDDNQGLMWFPMPEHLYSFRIHEGILFSLVRLESHDGDDYATWLHPALNLLTRAVPGIHGVAPNVMKTLLGAGVLCAMCGTEKDAVQTTEEHITKNFSPTQYIGM